MALGDAIANLAVTLSLDASDFATGSTKVQRDMGKLQTSFKALGDKWMQTGKQLSIGVTAPLTAFGLMSAKTASDAKELDSAFSETFGNLTNEMRSWAQTTGDAMGRSTQAMQEMANTFGIFFNQAAPTRKEAAEMSKVFAVLAQDLSSFYNVDGDVALQKLRSGLSGESEPLRDFGVFLTEATVNAKGLEMGLGGLTGELSEQEKIMARYQLILEATQNAQGDVARTSSGAANQWRSFTEALKELQVVIGEKLLPVLTPLVTGMTKIVNGFNNLPSGVQTAIVAFGALAASIGPMMLVMGTLAATVLPLLAAKFGPVGIAISAFINPLGTAISFLVKFAAQLAGMTILKTIGGLLLRFAGPLGLIASAGALIYANWDRISGLFQYFWATAKATIGPPLQELVAVLREIFAELWEGPFGEGIRMASGALSAFGGEVSAILGDALIRVLKGAMEFTLGVFRQIASAIRIVTAVLKGDWASAWEAAKALVTNVVDTLRRVLLALAPEAVAAMRQMYTGVKTWLQDKLGAVFEWVNDKVKKVESSFAWLYDRVVGNSWIPDMVDEVGQHMSRLQQVMVDPATRAAQETDAAFRSLASDVSGLLDRLFPKIAALRTMKEELATLDAGERAGLLSPELAQESRFRLRGGGREATVSEDLLNAPSLIEGMEKVKVAAKDLADKTSVQTVRIAESFKDMADKTMSAIEGLVGAIRGGGFLDILGSAVGLFLQLGSAGLFGKGIAQNINAVPAYAGGTNYHPGGLALVGERGPELVSMPRGSQVYTNRESMGMMGGSVQVEVVANNDGFGAIVRNHAGEVVAQAAPTIAKAGAMGALRMAQRRQSRRLA